MSDTFVYQNEENLEEKKKRTKAVYQTFITKLTLFSKFQHPLSISQEPRLSKLYNDLLLHRDIAVQQVGYGYGTVKSGYGTLLYQVQPKPNRFPKLNIYAYD